MVNLSWFADFRRSQFFTALKLLGALFVGGALGYYALGLANPAVSWSLFDCFYMSTITLTTVGYGEVLDGMAGYPLARLYTIFLLLFGTGFLVYAASAATAFIIEGELGHLLEKRRMEREIEALDRHYIVCGAGSTGIYVAQELVETRTPFVAVENDPARVARLREIGCRLVVEGDATEDDSLIAAGIRRAQGLAACLSADRDNLFVTVTARDLNPNLRIVAKSVERGAGVKLTHAGASSTVSPALIGGLRLASELIRPAVVTFLDTMLRDKSANVRFAEVTVEPGSALAGNTVGQADVVRRLGLPILALKMPGEGGFRYNPGASEVLQPGVVIVVMAPLAQVEALQSLASTGGARL